MQTEILDTGEAVSLEQVAQEIQAIPEVKAKFKSPTEKYSPGFKFNRLRRDGSLEEITIERYLSGKKTFIVSRAIGELQTETEMPLKRIEAMAAPELEKNPVGTNVIIPFKGKKVAGKMAGYLKESDEYVIRIHETGKKPQLVQISRESFDAVNYREYRRRVEELLH
jgi:hypothetical protein